MSRLAMGATLAMASSFALLLALLLFLLIRFFLSLLHNKMKNKREFTDDPPEQMQSARPLSFPFYGHGVLKAPTEYLLSIPNISISNPVYEEAVEMQPSNANAGGGGGTPFATPEVSPSHLEIEVDEESNEYSPPLRAMKKLPSVLPKAYAGVYPFEGGQRSLGASTETNRLSSSTSSNSLCSSPSW